MALCGADALVHESVLQGEVHIREQLHIREPEWEIRDKRDTRRDLRDTRRDMRGMGRDLRDTRRGMGGMGRDMRGVEWDMRHAHEGHEACA